MLVSDGHIISVDLDPGVPNINPMDRGDGKTGTRDGEGRRGDRVQQGVSGRVLWLVETSNRERERERERER